MRVKYHRVSTIGQTGNRFLNDTDKYDLILLDKVSGNIRFYLIIKVICAKVKFKKQTQQFMSQLLLNK